MSPIDFFSGFSGLFFLLIEFFDSNQLTFVTSMGPPASATANILTRKAKKTKIICLLKKLNPTQKSSSMKVVFFPMQLDNKERNNGADQIISLQPENGPVALGLDVS